jgi:hypothetical protein
MAIEKNEIDRLFIECILADFDSVKGEIARRSELQRVAILMLLTAYGFLFKFYLDSYDNKPLLGLVFVALASLASYLTKNFYKREHVEIMRLGRIIECQMAPEVKKLLGKEVFFSETVPNHSSETRLLQSYFDFVVYWIIPTLFFSFLFGFLFGFLLDS